MKKTILIILKLSILLLLVFTLAECPSTPSNSNDGDSDPSNGTITVNLINAGVADTKTFVVGIYNNVADPLVDTAVEGGSTVIASGTATYTTATAFTGGSNYDVWFFVDEDSSGTNSGPNVGDKYNNTAIAVNIDGNKTITVDYTGLKTK